MKTAIIYPEHHDRRKTKGRFLSYYYLHGQADNMNGYDLCSGDIRVHSKCMVEGIHFVDIKGIEGLPEYAGALLFTHFNHNRMEGLITLISNKDDIISALEYINKPLRIVYEHEQKAMKVLYPDIYEAMNIKSREIGEKLYLIEEAKHWYSKLDNKMRFRYDYVYNNRYRPLYVNYHDWKVRAYLAFRKRIKEKFLGSVQLSNQVYKSVHNRLKKLNNDD